MGPARDVVATIPRGQYDKLSARIEKTSDMNAPIAQGDQLGDIVVSMGAEEVTRIPLVALQDLPKGGLWRQAKDSVLRMF